MEKTLQEEADELAKNVQVNLVINLIKENIVPTAVGTVGTAGGEGGGGTLTLAVNSITARSLAKAMWVNSSILCLDLSSNALNDHAGSYLARILNRNNTIKKLELDNNNLGILSHFSVLFIYLFIFHPFLV
jgi:hypothetical protein